MSPMRGPHGRAGDDRGSRGDPANPDAPRGLHGVRGGVAGYAGITLGGRPLRIEAHLTPARFAQLHLKWRIGRRSRPRSFRPGRAALTTRRPLTPPRALSAPREPGAGGARVRDRTLRE